MIKLGIKNRFLLAGMCLLFLCSCNAKALAQSTTSPESPVAKTVQNSQPTVYMSNKITAETLLDVYGILNLPAKGKVAVKLHSGEPSGKYYLQPEFVKPLIEALKGTVVDSNVAYGGARSSTAKHMQVMKDNGWTAVAPVDILDAQGDMSLPVKNGTRLQENYVGSHFKNYDFYVVLSHFKGHAMGGFGGAIKNASIGIASSTGKNWIHSGAKSKVSWGGVQDEFLECMAEAAKSVNDARKNKILYINVMNNISVDCDCAGGSALAPDMHDIGILSSLDPVALDQACVDLIYAAKDGKSVQERIESRNGIHTLEHAEKIGLGSRKYNLVMID